MNDISHHCQITQINQNISKYINIIDKNIIYTEVKFSSRPVINKQIQLIPQVYTVFSIK